MILLIIRHRNASHASSSDLKLHSTVHLETDNQASRNRHQTMHVYHDGDLVGFLFVDVKYICTYSAFESFFSFVSSPGEMGRRLFEVWQRTMIRRGYSSKCAILFIHSQNDPIPPSASELSPSSALGNASSSLRREIKVSQNWTDSEVREDTLKFRLAALCTCGHQVSIYCAQMVESLSHYQSSAQKFIVDLSTYTTLQERLTQESQ
jgi:hypothetical protein